MLKLLGKIPNEFTLACSGGVDSMVALDFFLRGGYKPMLAYFHHGTEHGDDALKFVLQRGEDLGLGVLVGRIEHGAPLFGSREAYWRDQRYKFLDSIIGPVVMAHHLNDVAEWWIFTALRGNPRLMPYSREKYIRPFLATPKADIVEWAERHDVQNVEDPSNRNLAFTRNFIRHGLMPGALVVNPGLLTVMRKKVQAEYNKEF